LNRFGFRLLFLLDSRLRLVLYDRLLLLLGLCLNCGRGLGLLNRLRIRIGRQLLIQLDRDSLLCLQHVVEGSGHDRAVRADRRLRRGIGLKREVQGRVSQKCQSDNGADHSSTFCPTLRVWCLSLPFSR
jgi:hypothetical protein